MGSTILTRVVVLALVSHAAYALTPLSPVEDDSDCALYLNGPGRSTAYDYTLNLLKGNFGYEGQHTCITYDAVNQAYLEARNRIVVSHPKGEWKAEDYASVGELILDISINLAKRYGLTYEEIEKGLPLIDTSRTLIRNVCPPVFSHVECRAGKYRRLDGLCNNLEHPTWGSTMSPFQRLIGPLFSDGINAPRIAHTGRDLPLSRVVSRTMHPDEGYHDHAGTVMVIAWGQFMDHDYTLTGTPLDPINRNDPEECCSRPQHLKHPYCNEIRIPDDDYFYRLWGVKCIDFVRAFPSPRPGCRLGSRVPFNTLTGAIDGNTVYGVTEKFSRKLRTGYGGLLRMNPVFKEYGLKDLLPLKLDIPDEGCTRPNKNMYCFEGGEIRVNEQLVLTVMHTLMAREHNRVAKGLAAVNPHWDDETLFQEARRINVAEIQHITYNEFLPILLGKDVMEKFGLVLEKQGYWDGYDPNVNPDVIDAFASAAFRFGHSLLPTAVERWSKAHKFIASKRLSDLIRRPYDLYRAGVLDEYVMGLMNQVAQAMDDSITQEVTNHLFKKVGARFGMDLVSFNMQRGREFGIPGYMEFRKFCGLNGADTFQDLFGSMPNETVRKYETIFEHPIDVDLWSGGVSERPLPGSMLGPTFACVIATQFSYSRRGDRFWFELPNQPSSFTPEQLVELRKARLARVICDNTDIIDTVQLYPMVLPDHELNPRVPCRSGIIPSIDFSKWAEPAPFHGHSAGSFITEAFIPAKNETGKETQAEDYTNNTNNNSTTETNNEGKIVTNKINSVTTDADQLNICQNNTNQNCTFIANTCTNCTDTSKEAYGHDRVLKYVYKNDERDKMEQKNLGHIKNSITRRRRRSVNKTEGDTLPASSARLIVNYETLHEPQPFNRHKAEVIKGAKLADFNIETLEPQPFNRHKAEVIKGAKLADFNIETLHDAHPGKNINEETSKVSDDSRSTSDENSSSYENDREKGYVSTENDEDRKGQRKTQYIESEENAQELRKQSNESGERSTENIEGYQDDSKRNIPYRERDSREHNDKSKESFRHENDHNSSEESDKYIPQKRSEKIGDRNESAETNESSQENISPKSDYNIHRSEHSKDKGISYQRRENIRDHTESGESNENNPESNSSISPYRKHRTDNKDIPYTRRENFKEHKESNESDESRRESNPSSRPYNKHRSEHSKDKYVPYQRRENISDQSESDERNKNSQESNSPSSPYIKHRPEYSDEFQDKSVKNNDDNDDQNRKKRPYDVSTENNEYANKPRSSQLQSQEQYNTRDLDPILYKKDVSPTSLNDERNKSDYSSSEEDDDKYKKKSYDTSSSRQNSAEDDELSKTRKTQPLYLAHNVNLQSSNLTESGEQDVAIAALNRKNFPNKEEEYQQKSSPIAIKDVDLGDFSYEQIQVNKNGDIEPVRDTHENYDEAESSNTPPSTVQTEVENHRYSKPKENILYSTDTVSRSAPIDDDEVKPVVEINPEQDENSKEALKSEPNDDTSLESLLGVKSLDSDENNEKISTTQETQNKGDVKQQFERIPLNYDHDKSNKETTDSIERPITASPQDSQIKDDSNKNVDTNIHTPLLPNDRYDDHLNYKFDDISIKLPEIRLPDDILAVPYDYKEPPYKKLKNSNKQPKENNFYQYNENKYRNENEPDNDDEEPQNVHRHDEHANHDDPKEVDEDDGPVHDHGYHDYYGQKDKKASYKHEHDNNDDEDSDEEDLYEKFVRERFGKRGSFEKRAARLEDSPPAIENAKLFDSLQKVLKKAQNIEKEAKKSGDPNAGYAWTLEYGQKL